MVRIGHNNPCSIASELMKVGVTRIPRPLIPALNNISPLLVRIRQGTCNDSLGKKGTLIISNLTHTTYDVLIEINYKIYNMPRLSN